MSESEDSTHVVGVALNVSTVVTVEEVQDPCEFRTVRIFIRILSRRPISFFFLETFNILLITILIWGVIFYNLHMSL